jgi:hypothetical protein
MLLAVVLVLMLGPADLVTIYVGPNAKDGFVDVDKGVRDSITDLQSQLPKDRAFRVVETEPKAALVLRVVSRGLGPVVPRGTLNLPGTATYYPGQTLTFPNRGTVQTAGTVVQTPGMSIPIESQARHIETVLHVGAYERAFVAENQKWGQCTRMIAKDLSVWLAANRERIKPDTPPTLAK